MPHKILKENPVHILERLEIDKPTTEEIEVNIVDIAKNINVQ